MPTTPTNSVSIAARAPVRAPATGPQRISYLPLATHALAVFFAAGSLVGFLAVLLPHDSSLNAARVLVIAGTAAAAAAMIALVPGLGPTAQNILVAGGTLLITLAIDAQGTTHLGFAFMYVWVMLYAAVFFGNRALVLHVGLAAICFGGLLILRPTESAATEWLILMITLVTAGVVISRIRAFADDLVDRLESTTRTDPLTGVANRRAFDETLEAELDRARRLGGSLALLIGDIDHFKAVNDVHGHGEGDEVLRLVGRSLREGQRPGELVARLGGEEFALVLPGIGVEGAVAAANRARRAVRDAIAVRGLDATMSVGLATYPDAGGDAATLMRAADEALYSAKRLGRDRVGVAGSTDVPGGCGADRRTIRSIIGRLAAE